jgi:hypothetical protein
MNIKQQFTTVTRLSKIVASILFIALPFIGFYLGMKYEESILAYQPTIIVTPQSRELSQSQVAPIDSEKQRQTEIDTTEWKTLKNKFGWSIKYPPTWEASGQHNVIAEDFVAPIIQGPKGCYKNKAECGSIQVDVPSAMTDIYKNVSPSQYELEKFKNAPFQILKNQNESLVNGNPAFEVTYLISNDGQFPNGRYVKEIAIKHKEDIYVISYDAGSNDSSGRGITGLPEDWQLAPVFGKMLSTLKFSE